MAPAIGSERQESAAYVARGVVSGARERVQMLGRWGINCSSRPGGAACCAVAVRQTTWRLASTDGADLPELWE